MCEIMAKSKTLACTKVAFTFSFLFLSFLAIAQNKSDDNTVRLESTIVGDKEQPAVSYFIPWQDVGTPDKLQWNIDRKHDNTLDLVDRDVMLRSMKVYSQMNMESP